MAVARDKQSAALSTNGTSGTVTWSVNPAAGSKVLLFVQYNGAVTSVVDNGTSPSTFVKDVGTSAGKGAAVYRADNITLPSSGSYSVTITVPTSGTIDAGGWSYTGAASGGPDATNSGSGTGTAVTTGSAAPAAIGGVVFGGFSDASGLNPETITFTGASPLTQQFVVTNGSSYWACAAADGLADSAQTMTWTLGDSVAWGAVIAAYSPASTGGGGGGGTNPTWDPSGSWVLQFEDEFTSTTLNPVWQPGWFGASGVTPPVNSGSPQNNSANVTLPGDGTLHLAITSSYGALVTTNPHNSATATGYQLGPSAAFEARIYIPGSGATVYNWPAWWTDGQDPWPSNGEVDIMEGLSGTTNAHVHDNTTDGPGGSGAPGIDHNTGPGWHTFGCYRQATTVQFFYDSVSIGSLAIDTTSPHYLILVNTAPSTSGITPAVMQVDWVRAWTPGTGGGSTAPGTPTGLTVTGTTDSTVSLAWDAPLPGPVTGYHVYQGGTLAATITSAFWTATGLTASTTYSFTVDAYNSNGNSAQTSPVTATTSPEVSAPSEPPVTWRPGWPALAIEAALVTARPVQAAGTFLLDDTASGLLDTNTLGAADTWTGITAWTRSGTIVRPSTRQQGPVYAYQPGTATIILNNADGRFDPDNTGGPYVAGGQTQLTAMVPVRVRAFWDGTWYSLFTGYADSWDDDGQNYAGRYAETTLAATDGQKVLAGINLPPLDIPAGGGETSGARISRILTAASWYTDAARRVLDTGNSTVQAATLGDTAWNLAQAAADTEIGELYIDGDGAVVFRQRHAILTDARSATSQATFGDAAGELPYRSVTRARDDATIANDVQATTAGGIMQEATDPASITKFLFPRTYTRDGLLLQDDASALSWAQWVLYVAKDDEDRFDELVIYPQRDPAALWPHALGRQIGDRITVTRRPPGVSSPVTKDCFIRGIRHEFNVSSASWATTWTLQDAGRYGSFLALDNATLGKLDANALAF